MNAARLLLLADFLDALPPERFNYSVWVGGSWGGAPDLSCGTTACALGWATTIPELREAGLRIVRGNDFMGAYVSLARAADAPPGYRRSMHAAAVVFDITMAEAERLFDPELSGLEDEEDATSQQVAQHIRSFVAQRPS